MTKSADPPRILFRDPGFVVVDKPAGCSVHRGDDHSRDTMMARVRDALGQWVHPVHRLDRGTSGVLVFALDSETASRLSASFRDGHVRKEYVALLRGAMEGQGVISHPLATHGARETVEAITEYEVLAIARDRYTLVLARLLTGKRHQIRRHFKHLSRPILGDTTYGDGRENRKMRSEIDLQRLALHARAISFPHPRNVDEEVQVIAPLPADLRQPLERLGFTETCLDAIDRRGIQVSS